MSVKVAKTKLECEKKKSEASFLPSFLPDRGLDTRGVEVNAIAYAPLFSGLRSGSCLQTENFACLCVRLMVAVLVRTGYRRNNAAS